jgi:phosphoribosylanthranilate isomerase
MKLGIARLGRNKIIVAIYDTELKRIRIDRVSSIKEVKEIIKTTKPARVYLHISAQDLEDTIRYMTETKIIETVDIQKTNEKLNQLEKLSIIRDSDLPAIGAVLSEY